MATLNQENRYRGYQGLYPIIEYAHKIGKNTADLTTIDMVNFMKWWLKQPVREDIVEATAAQRETYYKDVAAMKQYREEEKMGKNSGKNKSAMTSRLSSDQVVDIDQVDEGIAEEMQEEMVENQEVVCEMGLTKLDVTALLFAISRVFEDYDMEGHEYGVSLIQLKEGLEAIE